LVFFSPKWINCETSSFFGIHALVCILPKFRPFLVFSFFLKKIWCWVSLETQEHPTQHIKKGQGQLVELQWNGLSSPNLEMWRRSSLHYLFRHGLSFIHLDLEQTFMLIVDLTYGQKFLKVLQTHPSMKGP
jgi:hypothetical protein